jgi:alanine racemase
MKAKPMQWIEIDSSALSSNVHQFRRLIGKDRRLLATVKANAYGHGLLEVATIALRAGVDWLGVHSIEEGIFLREKKVDCPILVLGYVSLNELDQAIEHDLRLTVYNPETIERLADLASRTQKKIRLHLKVETGTHRQGILEENVLSFSEKIREHPGLVLEGMSSHFANIEDTTNHSYARFQLDNFKRMAQKLEAHGIGIPIKHMSCTAAAILFPETYFDMVRIGIGMYGLWPSKETYLSCILQNREPIQLKPVLSWKARIAQIKKIPKGAFVGYGCTFRATRETTLAVLPLGYFDGYGRQFSNVSFVLIKGQRAPVRGRIAMDFMMTDVTDIPDVEVEDEAVLVGEDGGERLTVDDLAALAETINYEIIARINPLIPRLVVPPLT